MNSKKNVVVIVSIVLMLLAIIATTYAYFSITINGNANATSVIVSTANLGIAYEEGNEINMANASPGWSDSKTFTVKNNSTVTTYYNIEWTNVSNSFANQNDLVYTLTGTNSKEETLLPNINGLILQNISIASDATHSYTLTLTYKNTASNQVVDMETTFTGKIIITEST